MRRRSKISTILESGGSPVRGVTAFLLIALVFGAEIVAPEDSSLELFYLLPIGLAAWSSGRRFGLFVAFLAAIAPYFANVLGHKASNWMVETWNGAMRLGVFSIITLLLVHLREAVERLQELAATDDLTGAANARTFHERCRIEMARARRRATSLTLLYLDLDNFKEVNDDIGHLAGDAVLKTVVDTIRENVRPYDLVARMGGDEFAVLFPDVDDEAAAVIREKIRDVVAKTMAKRGFPVTCSIGSVTFKRMPEDTDDLIRTADDAMSEAKRRGKNMVVHRVL